MHLKRLYKALAMVITVAMILPFAWVGADTGAQSDPAAASVVSEVAPTQQPLDVATPESENSLAQETPVVNDETTNEETPIVTTPTDDEEGDDVNPDPTGTDEDGVDPEPTGTDEDDVDPEPTGTDEDDADPETPIPTESAEPTETPTTTPKPKPTEQPVEPTPTPTLTPTPVETQVPAAPDPVAAATVPEEVKQQTTGYGSNSALVNAQNIVAPNIVVDTLRFKKIDKVYGVISAKDVQIKEEQNDDSRAVGTIAEEGLCYVIDETDSEDWYYVESGLVRGFVRRESVLTGEKADKQVKEKGEGNMKLAQSLVEPLENLAFTYTKTTTRETVVDKIYAMSNEEDANVREENNTEARVIGTLPKGAVCFVIADQDEEWVYIEADNVRGFVRKDMITIGEDVQEQLEVSVGWTQEQEDDLTAKQTKLQESKDQLNDLKSDKKQANAAIRKAEKELEDLEEALKEAQALEEQAKENAQAEVTEEASETKSAEATETPEVTDEAEETLEAQENTSKAEEAGEVDETAAPEVTETATPAVTEVPEVTTTPEASEVEKAQVLVTEKETQIAQLNSQVDGLNASIGEIKNTIDADTKEVSESESNKKLKLVEAVKATPTVKEEVKPEENKAFYYTITSTKDVTVSGSIGEAMVTFASQFLGNPYVWGGTSLTDGADCSGYVQQIYKHFGYDIPRTSREQSVFGEQIPISEARTGDLIFYANSGTVYHVVMYVGDGRVINASSSKTGIIMSNIDTAHAVWATRIISDEDYDNIDEVNAKAAVSYGNASYTNAIQSDYGQMLGNFKLTAYCNCPICCGKWSGGPTASGTAPTEGRTVAMAGVPFGTKLIINGKIYTVEDRGTPYGHVDIYIDDHAAATQFGVQNAQVYAVK